MVTSERQRMACRIDDGDFRHVALVTIAGAGDSQEIVQPFVSPCVSRVGQGRCSCGRYDLVWMR